MVSMTIIAIFYVMIFFVCVCMCVSISLILHQETIPHISWHLYPKFHF